MSELSVRMEPFRVRSVIQFYLIAFIISFGGSGSIFLHPKWLGVLLFVLLLVLLGTYIYLYSPKKSLMSLNSRTSLIFKIFDWFMFLTLIPVYIFRAEIPQSTGVIMVCAGLVMILSGSKAVFDKVSLFLGLVVLSGGIWELIKPL